MKNTIKQLWILAALSPFFLTACDGDNSDPEPVVLEVETVSDLDAVSTSNYTFFSLENNTTLTSADSASNKWDIAFRGSTIIVNSGTSGPGTASAQIVEGIFEEIAEAPATGYAQDSQSAKAILGSGGWYTYTAAAETGPQHAILPIPGRVIVVKTNSGKYAKIEIISYYKGNPDTSTSAFADLTTRPASRYYTFRYVLQTDGSTTFITE